MDIFQVQTLYQNIQTQQILYYIFVDLKAPVIDIDKLNSKIEKLQNIFSNLNFEQKLKVCKEFIKIKNELVNQNLTHLQKNYLIQIANVLSPFYSAHKAKELANKPVEKARKETGKYDDRKNNCRHFVFNLSKELYEGLINTKNLDWKKSPKTTNPQISREFLKNKENNKKINKKPIHYQEVFNIPNPTPQDLLLTKGNFLEGDIIWIRRKNNTYHVGIIVNDFEGVKVVDFSGKVNKKSIEEFCKNTTEVKIFRLEVQTIKNA